MRCLPLILPSLPLKVFPYLAYIAACLIALAGPVAMAGYDGLVFPKMSFQNWSRSKPAATFSGCLSLSANWFPPSERNFATSVKYP